MSVEIAVIITGSEFTIGELQELLDTARGVDGIPANALVAVTHDHRDDPTTYTLTISSADRNKA